MKISALFSSFVFSSLVTLVGCGAASLQEQRPLSLGIENKKSTPVLRSEASITGKIEPTEKAQQAGVAQSQSAPKTDLKVGLQTDAAGAEYTSTSSTTQTASVDAAAAVTTKTAFEADLERKRNQIQYVSLVYLACLGREADSGGLIFWSNLLAAGQSSFDEVKFGICNQSLEGQLSIAYREILGRFPDAGGRAFWLKALNSGTSLANVRAQLMNSTERTSLTSAQLLTKIQQINSVIQGYEVLLADLKRRTV